MSGILKNIPDDVSHVLCAFLGGSVVFTLMAWISQDEQTQSSPLGVGLLGGVIAGLVQILILLINHKTRHNKRRVNDEVNNG